MHPKRRAGDTNGCNVPPTKAMKLASGTVVLDSSPIFSPSNNRTNGRLLESHGVPFSLALKELYSESTVAKIWGVARRDLDHVQPPRIFPEYTKPGSSSYVYRELEFWTSGFFPGCLHLLLERRRKYHHLIHPPGTEAHPHPMQLSFACKWWTDSLHQNATLLGTHDIGFMVMPWARLQWELNHDRRSFETMVRAANTLAGRFNDKVSAIRSWDTCTTKIYNFDDPSKDFLVIIDNMMNIDLLFWAAANHPSSSERQRLYNIALHHTRTSQKYHVKSDSSTTHVVNFDQVTGKPREYLTNQGYSHKSCWSRGQAWAIAGFAQAAAWTGDESFLTTARNCAEYFIKRSPSDTVVPPWDFDAPEQDDQGKPQPRDTSAGIIAAYGMLIIHDVLTKTRESSGFLDASLKILNATCLHHLNERAEFREETRPVEMVEHGVLVNASKIINVHLGNGDTIVNGATINNFEHAPRRWANHGLVYADYFFLLSGNKLLEMGIGETILRGGL